MFQRVTLRDIAKDAGVHFTTVGLALRNDPARHSRHRRQGAGLRP
jgi:DNA-binding LacI/PurR family transcriptional regulator